TNQNTISIILGMFQIETLKQLREIEANRYDMDTIVCEAYKTLRMLKWINAVVVPQTKTPNIITSQTENLITDVKVIIGLTTISNFKEKQLVIHARRICSAEQELFNSGATVSRKYVESEEEYEYEARRIIKEEDPAAAAAYSDEEEELLDALPSRIPTNCSQDTGYNNDNHNRRRTIYNGSELRTLCVKIAQARNNKEDITSEQIYKNMIHDRYYNNCEYYEQSLNHDDTFSNTQLDDEYTQRRIGLMRQMSSS
ncbi:MAG: hypothetical protein EBU66_20605, partial [Bacteroidetes bacterium]|nr:hypothetical protein [Bacteroidota bacterium]